MPDIKNILNRTVSVNFQGMPWMTLFAMLLVTLKCFGKFPYSWWWATAPMWMPAVLGIGFLLGIISVALVIAAGAFIVYAFSEGYYSLRSWYYQRQRRKSGVKP